MTFNLLQKDVMQNIIKSKPIADNNSFNDQFFGSKGIGDSLDSGKFAEYFVNKHILEGVDGSLFQYKQSIRQPLNTITIEKMIIGEMNSVLIDKIKMVKYKTVREIYNHVQTIAESPTLKEKFQEVNSDKISLMDGILDLKTWQIKPAFRGDYMLYRLPYDYTKLKELNEKPIVRENFLDEILEGWKNKEEIKNFLQEYIGYLFIPSTRFEKSLLFYGNGGNGKGVLLETIRSLLGHQNTTSVGLHELNDRQNMFLLLGKLVNIDSDIKHNVQLDDGNIKKIISGEQVVGKSVYKNPTSFIPYARLLLATNELPYLKSIDDAIRRRFVFIHLKNNFIGREDPLLKQKLKKELDLIFLWALGGLKRLLERGYFDIPKELSNDVDKFIKENDSVAQFLESEYIYTGKDMRITNRELSYAYQHFCRDNGFKALGQIKLTKRLVEKGFEKFTNGNSRGIIGLGRTEW